MKILNHFKTVKSQAQRINELEFAFHSVNIAGCACNAHNDVLVERNTALEKENAELRRVVGGFRAGQTRRENKQAEK